MKFRYFSLLAAAAAPFSLAVSSQAALVTGWTNANAASSVVFTNAGTASPTFGTGAESSADAAWPQASFPTLSLSTIGTAITLSGSATFTGISGSNSLRDMFRIGLFNSNGSTDDTGWLGYWAANGDLSSGGRLYERDDPNTITFGSSNGATLLATAAGPGAGITFESGAASDTYNFSLMITQVASGMQIDSSIIRTSDSQEMGAHSFLDTSVSVSDFNRVGFLFGGSLDVDQIQLNNITVVPEPSAALLGSLGLLALLRRRRN